METHFGFKVIDDASMRAMAHGRRSVTPKIVMRGTLAKELLLPPLPSCSCSEGSSSSAHHQHKDMYCDEDDDDYFSDSDDDDDEEEQGASRRGESSSPTRPIPLATPR